jgi:hypothetical protein
MVIDRKVDIERDLNFLRRVGASIAASPAPNPKNSLSNTSSH